MQSDPLLSQTSLLRRRGAAANAKATLIGVAPPWRALGASYESKFPGHVVLVASYIAVAVAAALFAERTHRYVVDVEAALEEGGSVEASGACTITCHNATAPCCGGGDDDATHGEVVVATFHDQYVFATATAIGAGIALLCVLVGFYNVRDGTRSGWAAAVNNVADLACVAFATLLFASAKHNDDATYGRGLAAAWRRAGCRTCTATSCDQSTPANLGGTDETAIVAFIATAVAMVLRRLVGTRLYTNELDI